MNQETQVKLLKELLQLHESRSAFVSNQVTSNPVDHYRCPERFELERQTLFADMPQMAAHCSELAQTGAFVSRTVAGQPLLLTRDEEGEAHAFLNVCRHRGTRLVAEESGCRNRFSCPYHAWTYTNRGRLLGIPHQKDGFPELDKADLGLIELPCEERFGWIWVLPNRRVEFNLADFLGDLSADLAWLSCDTLSVVHDDIQDRKVNWKILVEGGIESYHFRVAHRSTIGPYFNDNLSSYQSFGPHMRSVLSRVSMNDLPDQPPDSWDIRQHANLLYTIFPGSSLLVQQDHIVWIQNESCEVDRTRIRIATLAPAGDQRADYWERNHKITLDTLNEDFDIGESIQANLHTGANEQFTFGRFESALARFNSTVDNYLQSAGRHGP